MHHSVREEMQVDALGGDVGADQHPHWILQASKPLDNVLLVDIRHSFAVQDGDYFRVDAEILREVLLQKTKGFEPLCKDHEPVVRHLSRPAETAERGILTDQAHEFLVLAEPFDADGLDEYGKGAERRVVRLGLWPLFA